MKIFIFIYIISIVLYYVFGIWQLKRNLEKRYEYNIIQFIGIFIILPFVPLMNSVLVIVLIQIFIEESNAKENLNKFLRKILKVN